MKYFSTLVVNPKENNPPALLTCISDSQIANYFLFYFFIFSYFFSDWLFSFKLIIFLFNLFPKKKLLKTKTQQYKKTKQTSHGRKEPEKK